MHFETVLKHLLLLFKENQVKYALIGGVSLGLHGYARATIDLDFLILTENVDLVDQYLTKHGYRCLSKSEQFASYVSKNPILGRVDLMLTYNDLLITMLKRAKRKKFSEEIGFVSVLSPEDLIGLKLLAVKHDSKRYFKDMADVQELIRLYGKKLDYGLLKEHFSMYNKLDELKELWKNANE